MLELENEIFKDYQYSQGMLLKYGFSKSPTGFVYKTFLEEEDFTLVIAISGEGEVKASVYDGEESYETFRMSGARGFASKIKEEVIEALLSVRKVCFISTREPDYYLLPSNPAMYDVGKGFETYGGELTWPARRKLKKGDIVFIYSSLPFGAIRYLCIVDEVGQRGRYGFPTTIVLMKTLQNPVYSYSWLREKGQKTVRFLCKMSTDAARAILEEAQ